MLSNGNKVKQEINGTGYEGSSHRPICGTIPACWKVTRTTIKTSVGIIFVLANI
jgi:hypothetical protein